MSAASTPPVGSIGWADLTVPDASPLRDFYSSVVGWNVDPVDMGGYQDFCMQRPDDGAATAGICHARGPNAGLPPQWLVYFTVADLDASIARCAERGGKILVPPRQMGSQGRFCVIVDPAGAICALWQAGGGTQERAAAPPAGA